MYSEKSICHFKLGIPKTQHLHHYHNHYCQHLCHHGGKIATKFIFMTGNEAKFHPKDGSIIEDVHHNCQH